MQTIKDLINRIKWDKRENPDDYTLGYEDRVAKKIIEVSFNGILRFEEGFMVMADERGEEAMIPLHRVRVVKKKDVVVWSRG